MSKLMLSVDERILSRAKRYAKRHGISVSKLVKRYLAAVTDPSSTATPATPILGSLRGCLKKADLEGYRKHLAAKYQ